MITADELRKKYLDFFVSKGHVIIPSASLIPENDPTVLFTTAGMHPLVPFLLGESHPAGKRLVNYQRCIRTSDIDLVGDDTHLTFFEMLGNWSLGDYWKKEAIEWSWEFLTDKKWLGLDPKRIYVTCFAGDKDAPRDDESAEFWKSVGVPDERIAFLGKNDNWWGPAGQTGPCGPDTEMFYQMNTDEDEKPEGVTWPKGKYVEIWNDVFMQYNKTPDGTFVPLKQKNVDTGMGVERTLAVLNGMKSIFETEVFLPLIEFIKDNSGKYLERSARVVVDHFKASLFIISDGVLPAKNERGYVVRRLIRDAFDEMNGIQFNKNQISGLCERIVALYKENYPSIQKLLITPNEIRVFGEKADEATARGKRYIQSKIFEIQSNPDVAGLIAFDARQTMSIRPEDTYKILFEKGINIDSKKYWDAYNKAYKNHQNISRKGAEQKFKGGLADHSEVVVRMHTATHLLHQALKDVLGDHVAQKGSNITSERLRFDFTHPQKMTKEELQKVESIVNEKIKEAIPVEKKILPITEARKLNATGLFGEKYGDTVSVYLIGDYSKEFCGGPHVANTKEIGRFKIKKEEAVSAVVRRIKAVVL